MGKRSNFKRKARDAYPTPLSAIVPLLPFLKTCERFCEPCAGDGRMRDYLISKGHHCAAAWDIKPRGPHIDQQDARIRLIGNITSFITNPPWSRDVLHPIISNLSSQHTTFLLFDADWMHTRQSSELIKKCSLIVSVGRVKWIAKSKFTGKDNVCWYRFDPDHKRGPKFVGRQ